MNAKSRARPARRLARVPRRGAGLSVEAGARVRAFQPGGRVRRRRAAGRAQARRGARAAVHRRKPRRLRRNRGHRAAREIARGRLRDHDDFRHLRLQPAHVQRAALRRGEGFCARHAAHALSADSGRASEPQGEDGPRVRRLCKSEPREAELRLGRARLLQPPRIRALQGDRRNRAGSGPLQRRRPRDQRSARGHGASDAHPGGRRDRAERPVGQAGGPCHQRPAALAAFPGPADDRGFLSGLRDNFLGRGDRAGGHASPHHRPAQRDTRENPRRSGHEGKVRRAERRDRRRHPRAIRRADQVRNGEVGQDHPREEHPGRPTPACIHPSGASPSPRAPRRSAVRDSGRRSARRAARA